MDTKYVGNGGDFTEYEEWYTYITGLSTLTEDVECILTDDRDYPITDWNSGDFTALNFGAYQMHITSLPAVFHGGVWDTGPTLTTEQSTLIYLQGPSSPDQFFVTDLAFYNRRAIGDGYGPQHLGNITISRCLSSIITSGTKTNAAFHTNTNYGICKMDACAARAVGTSTESRGLFIQPYTSTTEVRGFTALGFGKGVAVYSPTSTPKVMKNIVTYNSITAGFFDNNSNGWGDASNNASDDGTHPGDDGVLITADPFEADGYTPSQGGQLDAAGIDVGVILGADGQPFALFPAIGAYPTYIPSDSVAPTLTNPTSEGDTTGLVCKVDTDEANGIIFAVATDTATQPTPEQVEAGQD
ncbi:MAG: hypothetical protein GY814_01090, partial [Gammaproteobacteria bacterium]|nr:hypothetical protein [Gammaproteobacteria bacterium]